MVTGTIQPLPPPPPAPPPPSISQQPYTYPPVIIILTITLLVFFFFGFFSIYFCRCFVENILCRWHLRHRLGGTPPGGTTSSATPDGLSPFLVQSFPTFTYSTVKDYRKEKYGLECAICLVEFQCRDTLRLLTTCYHIFHQECIDLWLESQKTCPVCRRNLDSPVQSPDKSPNFTANILEHMNEATEDSCGITIKNEDLEVERKACNKGQSVSSRDDDERGDDHAQNEVEKIPKSHSTGHSIAINKERGEDRFTLVLPEPVKSHIIKGHIPSHSCPTIGEFQAKPNTLNIALAGVSGLSDAEDKV